MQINITNKLQNIVIGLIVVLIGLFVVLSSSSQLSKNTQNITNQEYAKMLDNITRVEEVVSRFFKSKTDSLAQIYYDERIQKAIKMRNTRLGPLYQQKAQDSLKDFSIFKDYKDLILISPEYKIIGAVNRTLPLSEDLLTLLKNRVENYKNDQVILQKVSGRSMLFYIIKLNYSENNYAYLIMAEELFPAIIDMPNFENKTTHYFLVSKSLKYTDSLIRLNGKNSPEYFFDKEDTLMKYSKYFSTSFNYEGKQTQATVLDLEDKQYVYILGMLDPDTLEITINQSKIEIQDYYVTYYILLAVLIILYGLLVITKVNLQQQARKFIRMLKSLRSKQDEDDPSYLAKQIQDEAYSYTQDQDNTIRNAMFKAYSALKKMSPEDIRNLSIKNSLSKENIRLVYQPVVNAKTMKAEFCEVYLRLLNYYGEELMPSEFIPVLKHFNMLENLDEMMLEKVIKKIQTLQTTDQSAKISLNISSGAFNSDKFLRKLKSSFITGEISTNNVMLEIPALNIINDKRSVEFIDDLANYGVNFAVSITSLDTTTLKKIVNHKLKYAKIDMSSFADVLENEEKQKQLKQILVNAKKNDIVLIAERIETELMFKLAKSLDIELLQGYYIGKPKKYYTHK